MPKKRKEGGIPSRVTMTRIAKSCARILWRLLWGHCLRARCIVDAGASSPPLPSSPLLPRLKLKPPRCQGSCLIRGQQKELGRRYNESRVMRADCCTNLLPRTMPARVKLCKYRCLREGDGRLPLSVQSDFRFHRDTLGHPLVIKVS